MLITSVHSVEPATISKKCMKDYNVFYNIIIQYMYTLKRIYTNKCTAIWFLLFKLSLSIIFLTYVTTLVLKSEFSLLKLILELPKKVLTASKNKKIKK